MNDAWKKRVVAITGSTSGIGLACARFFLLEGARVVINGRDEQRLNKSLIELSSFGDRVTGVVADVSTVDGATKFAEAVKTISPSLDILVSCVGKGNVSEWVDAFRMNFYSHVYTVEACLPYFSSNGYAAVCLIGSIAGLVHLGASIPYAVAKTAVGTYAKELSFALVKKKIRVNVVHPGNVLFPGGRWEERMAEDSEGVREMINTQVPQKRFGSPEEIAAAVGFLCSPAASFITGATLIVDGGQVTTL